MAGYLDDVERTREAIRDGWYVTGDIAMIDDDGFIHITDRLSRFSKIAGEMVPHVKVEDCINGVLGEQHTSVVTSVADSTKGERLVAFYTNPQLAAHEVWERLCGTELPKLWIPKRDDLHFIENVPTLGTGKVDLRTVRRLAMEVTAASIS